MGNVTGLLRIVVPPRGNGKAVPQAAELDEPESDGEVDPRSQERHDHDGNGLATDGGADLHNVGVQEISDDLSPALEGLCETLHWIFRF